MMLSFKFLLLRIEMQLFTNVNGGCMAGLNVIIGIPQH